MKSAESQQATIGEESVLQPSDDELDAIERVLGYMFRRPEPPAPCLLVRSDFDLTAGSFLHGVNGMGIILVLIHSVQKPAGSRKWDQMLACNIQQGMWIDAACGASCCSCKPHKRIVARAVNDCCARRHPSLGAVNNARLALVGDAVLDVCALTDAYDAAPGMGALSVEGAFPVLLCWHSPAWVKMPSSKSTSSPAVVRLQ